jgi:hypothetical protein
MGGGLLWLASDSGDEPTRPVKLPTAEAASGDATAANVAPHNANSDIASAESVLNADALSEPAAAQAAREEAAERLRRFARTPHPEPNLYRLGLVLAAIAAPEAATSVLGSDAAISVLGPQLAAALRAAGPK